MIYRISTLLLSAGLGLMPQVLHAQQTQTQQTDPTPEKNQIRISIDQDMNGEHFSLDTAFQIESGSDLQELLRSMGLESVIDLEEDGRNVEIIINKRNSLDDELEGLRLEFNEMMPDLQELQSKMQALQKDLMIFRAPHGESRAMLGIYYEHEEAEGRWGARVTQIVEGSGAEKAGLQVGDVIYSINGQPFTQEEQIRRALVPFQPGDVVDLSVLREGSERTMQAELSASESPMNFEWQNGDDAFEFHWDGSDFDFKELPFFADPASLTGLEEKPFLGVYLDYSSDEGVRISGAVSESTAEEMGLQEGDIITAINGETVTDIESLKAAIASKAIGDDIAVQYLRNGKKMKAKAPLKGHASPMQGRLHLKQGLQGPLENLEEMIQHRILMEGEGLSLEFLKDLEQLRQLEDLNIFFSEEPFEFSEEEIEQLEGEGLNDRIVRRVAVFITMDNISETELERLNQHADPKISATNNLPVEGLYFSPNPNNGEFVFHFDLIESGPALVQLYDLNGRLVYTVEVVDGPGSYTEQVDVSAEPKGVYFLTVRQNGKSFSKKVVVQ